MTMIIRASDLFKGFARSTSTQFQEKSKEAWHPNNLSRYPFCECQFQETKIFLVCFIPVSSVPRTGPRTWKYKKKQSMCSMYWLRHPHPISECVIQVLAPLPSIQLPAIMHILQDSRRWLKYLGPCHHVKRPRLSSGVLAFMWPSPGCAGIWKGN